MALFGKDGRAVTNVCSALNQLAWIEPDLVLPELLERVYPSLESLTEAHRLHSCMAALNAVALPLLHRKHFPSGATHLLPILELILPALDLNDPTKLSYALLFLSKVFMSVPWSVASSSSSAQLSSQPRERVDDVDGNVPPRDAASIQTYDEICRDATHEFETFLSNFINRILALLEQIPAADSKQGNSIESTLIELIPLCCEILFSQLSPNLFNIVLDRYAKFLRTSVLPNAVRASSLLCGGLVKANSTQSMQVLIPLLQTKILHELDHGAGLELAATATSMQAANQSGGDHHVEKSGDVALNYYLSIMYVCVLVSGGGEGTLKFKDIILDVASKVWSKCMAFDAYKRATKIIRALITALSRTYVLDYRSFSEKLTELTKDHSLYWAISPFEIGTAGTNESETAKSILDVKWHVPSDEEVTVAVGVFKEFMEAEISKTQPLVIKMKSSGSQLNNDMMKSLTMLINMTRSMSMFVGDTIGPGADNDDVPGNDDGESMQEDEDVHMDGEDSDENWMPAFPRKRPIPAGYCLKDSNDPRYQYIVDVRCRLGALLHELISCFSAHREDNIENLKIVIKLIRVYLTDRGLERQQYDGHAGNHRTIKDMLRSDREREGKLYPRFLLVHRIYLQHLIRLRHNSLNIPLQSALTPADTVTSLVQDLLGLTISNYAEIRKCAQSSLFATLRCYPSSKYKLLPQIFGFIEMSAQQLKDKNADTANSTQWEKEFNVVKGCLYLLNSKTFLNISLRNWKMMARFMSSLAQAQLIDKVRPVSHYLISLLITCL
jgi:proteasome activator subunit 4